MKTKLLSIAFMAITGFSFGQTGSLWTNTGRSAGSEVLANKISINNPQLYSLDIVGLKSALKNAPKKLGKDEKSEKIITLPTSDSTMENFKVSELSNFDPALAAKYPEIKSYVGQSLENPANIIYFSVSPLGLSSMEIHSDNSAVFIEPYTKDATTYIVYKKSEKTANLSKFECATIDEAKSQMGNSMTSRPNADDAKLRTFRLAMSVTGEYTAYFGGTKALALAAINNTMTRVNAIFEKDFAARMVLIANNDAVIYTSASSDPYSPSSSLSNWNGQLQSTLTSVIGEANYDVGHLFGASGGGGNAGCIGCVCVNGSKGSGYTSPSDGVPSGDNFDVDYVAHELGHQFGANHTFSMNNEGTGANMEPGSGSTIMGYAGITAQDIQPHSDAYFHAISIQQVTNNIKNKTCPTATNTGNSIPTANAGLDYTIPKSTPFMLTGSGTDANGDVLTYNWEQMDNASSAQTAANSAAIVTKASGPNFRSYASTTIPTRYFPRMQSVLAGAVTTSGSEINVEALSSVARTLNFRFTVRDNRPSGSANNSDDTVITVNSTAGPFSVTSQATATSYAGGSSQTITWNVAGTTSNNINAANVDILWSTNSGNSWTTLLAGTPNDGSQAVTIPNTATSTGRIMVKGSNHVFFNVNKGNISVTAGSNDTTAPTAPTLSASGTTATSTNLSWTGATDNIGVTGYDVFRGTTLLGSTTSSTYNVSGLTPSTVYTFSVKAKDAAGNSSVSSNTVTVTTLSGTTTPTYCASTGNSVNDEYIGRFQLNTINNPSTGNNGYSDFTSISTSLNKSTNYTLTITPTWTGSSYNEGYAAWIDYNQDGDFDDAGELVWSKAASTTTPVSGSFTVPSNATSGATRIRISMKYNGVPTSCETFSYGEVEDYTVNIGAGSADTTAPTAPTSLAASGTTQTTTNLSWNASTDNVAVVGYDVYRNSSLIGTATSTSYAVSGLSASTTYSFFVKAKDAAGNISASSNTVSVTTLSNSVTYCAASASNTNDEKIGNVKFNTINNTSTGASGYEDFTSISTNVTRGSTYTLSITPQWTSTKYKEAYAVYIDYNGNGVFTDAGEKVFTKAGSTTSPVTGLIKIPTTATLGSTRMRVMMQYNTAPTSPCGTFTYGQVEDYTLNITSTAKESIAAVNLVKDFTIYPNPVKGNILYLENAESKDYKIYDMSGKMIKAGNISDQQIHVDQLSAGAYLLQVGKSTKRFIKL